MLSSLRVEYAVFVPKAAGMRLLFRFGTAPARQSSGSARTSDDHSPRRTGPLYRRVRRFVKRSHHRVGDGLIVGNALEHDAQQ